MSGPAVAHAEHGDVKRVPLVYLPLACLPFYSSRTWLIHLKGLSNRQPVSDQR